VTNDIEICIYLKFEGTGVVKCTICRNICHCVLPHGASGCSKFGNQILELGLKEYTIRKR